MKCPKCAGEMVRKPNMFALMRYDGTRHYHGQVCEPCNALYDDPEDSFKQAIVERAKARSEQTTED